MEEELNKQNPEVNSEPKMPKKSKKKFIIIGIAVVLVLVIAAIIFLVCTGKVNFTKKSKLFSAISKAEETFTAPLDALLEDNTTEISNNLEGKDIEYSAEITGSIDSFEGTMVDSELSAEEVELLKSLVNGAKINLDFKVDPKDKAFEGSVKGSIANLLNEVEADVSYNNNAISVSLPTFSDKKLAVFGDSVQGTEYAELAQVFQVIESTDFESIISAISKSGFTDEEIKHFEDTYDGLLKEQIDSDMIETKSGEIKVDGKDKKCTEVTVTLDSKDVQKIIEAYVDAFDSDDEGKDIIVEKASALTGILSQFSGQEMSKDQMKEAIDQAVKQIKDSIDTIDLGEKEIVITAYSSVFKTYGLELAIEEGDNSASILFTFGKDDTDISIEYMGKEVATGKLIDNKDTKSLQLSIDESGAKATLEMGVNLKSDTESEIFAKVNAEQNGQSLGAVDVSANVNVTKNEATEYAADTTMKFNLEIPNQAKIGFTVNVKESLKTADVNIPEINRTNAIDVLGDNSQTEVQNYVTEITPKLEEYVKNIESSEIYKSIMNMTTNSGTGTTDYSPYDYNTNFTNTTDYNAILNEMENYTSATNELMNSVSGNATGDFNTAVSY